mgnify:CR=1 FL=1
MGGSVIPTPTFPSFKVKSPEIVPSPPSSLRECPNVLGMLVPKA